MITSATATTATIATMLMTDSSTPGCIRTYAIAAMIITIMIAMTTSPTADFPVFAFLALSTCGLSI